MSFTHTIAEPVWDYKVLTFINTMTKQSTIKIWTTMQMDECLCTVC